MLEEKDQKLQEAVGGEEHPEKESSGTDSEKNAGEQPVPEEEHDSRKRSPVDEDVHGPTGKTDKKNTRGSASRPMEDPDDKKEEDAAGNLEEKPGKSDKKVSSEASSPAGKERKSSNSVDDGGQLQEAGKPAKETGKENVSRDDEGLEEEGGDADKDVLEEIDESNAEDAEDEDNQQRHHIPLLDYHSMSMENLVGELQRLVRNEKVQAIRKHADAIKYEFDLKFQDFLDEKKEEFISRGGNEADFRYNSVTKRQFNEVYGDYREKRNQYYRNLDQSLKENLAHRLEIIEELKSLVNIEEDINTTYKSFKELQERWRHAGPVPRSHYNDVWRTYHHHIEIFYDFLHLNRELRDLDFRHNLEEKLRLVERAEKLADEPDLNKAFRELQTLHKIWKEDIGPVDQEHREAIWERFSEATKAMHQRRQEHYRQIEKSYEDNLEKKNELIGQIAAIANNLSDNHRGMQQHIR
jgi:hypothetical protein